MPKQKTHRASVKRFKITAKGGLKRHHDQAHLQGEFASASAIRQALLQQQPYQQALPASSEQILQTSRIISWKDFFPFLKYQLLTTNLKQLGQIYQMNEGLQYKLQQEILQVNNFPIFCMLSKVNGIPLRVYDAFVYTLY